MKLLNNSRFAIHEYTLKAVEETGCKILVIEDDNSAFADFYESPLVNLSFSDGVNERRYVGYDYREIDWQSWLIDLKRTFQAQLFSDALSRAYVEYEA